MRYLFPYFFVFPVLFGCSEDAKVSSTEVEAPANALMRQLDNQTTGINFVNYIEESYENNIITNPYLYNGGGVAVLDYDQDGLEDVFFTATVQECKLYKNLGGMKFKDVTTESGINTKSGIKTGVTVVDIDGDGWEDVYICRTGLAANFERSNMAWINQQNGTFKEMAAELGLNSNAPSNHAAFFDFDLDGDLDMYLLNHPSDFSKVAQVRVVKDKAGKMTRDLESPITAESDRLYRNDNGKFSDVSVQMGVKDVAFGLSVSITDLNRDGWPDIIVGNDYVEPDIVYLNQQGAKMVDKTDAYFSHMSNNSMGADLADLNQDGFQELVMVDMLAPDYQRQQQLDQGMRFDRYNTLVEYNYKHQVSRNVLQASDGNGGFSETGCYSGVFQTDWSWGPTAVDFDLNGFTDLFMANGMRRDVGDLDYIRFTVDSMEKRGGLSPKTFPDINEYLNLIPSHKQRNFTYRNTGELRFEDVSVAWGIAPKTFTNGTAYADLDRDGDMDLILNNINDRAMVFQNTAADTKSGHYLNIKCESTNLKNKFAIGTKVQAKIGDKLFYKEIMPVRGFFSTSTLVTQIGLGSATQVDVLEVEFPGKKLVRKENVAADQLLQISDAEAKPGTLSVLVPKPAPLLAALGVAEATPHVQGAGQDFQLQRLLPWRISDAGPAMVTADLNADGLDDVFIGGGQDQAAQLFLQNGSGWSKKSVPAFEQDKSFLDAKAICFDANRDGHLDVLVGSGGAEWPANDPRYQARLYLNDGKANFTKSATMSLSLPCAALEVMDLDVDGDLDVVFAEGHTLQNYPLKRGLFCLLNDGKGVFTDATSTMGKEMQQLGAVSDLAAADLDADGQVELIAVGAWMPVMVWKRQGVVWVNSTEQFGLGETHGLWNSLEVADLNGDGKLDLVAGNLGWNTRYRASKQEPLTMYGADFDRNGAQDPIMCFRKDDKDYPFAYRDVLVAQVPAIKKKFIRYAAYAQADITEMFTKENVEKAEIGLCYVLESSVFYQQNGKFERRPLPNLVQTSCVYGISITDLNADGKPDVLLVGNDYGQQTETGRIDAGTGHVLMNKGNEFGYLRSADSGFWANKEAREAKVLKTRNSNQIWVTNFNGPVQVFKSLQQK